MATSQETFITSVQSTCSALADIMAEIARLAEENDEVFATGKALVLTSGLFTSRSVDLTGLGNALTALEAVRTEYLTYAEDILAARP